MSNNPEEDIKLIRKAADKIELSNHREKTKPTVELGICDTCVYCAGYERELGNVYYKCEAFNKAFDFCKPKIVRCNTFSKRGTLNINEMYNMAYLIEIDRKTIKGFAPDNDDNLFGECVVLESVEEIE